MKHHLEAAKGSRGQIPSADGPELLVLAPQITSASPTSVKWTESYISGWVHRVSQPGDVETKALCLAGVARWSIIPRIKKLLV